MRFLLFLFLFGNSAIYSYSQDTSVSSPSFISDWETGKAKTEIMGVKFTLPNDFKCYSKWVETPCFFWLGLDGIVESIDENVFILFSMPTPYTEKDSVELSFFFPENRPYLSPNKMHLNTILSDLARNKGLDIPEARKEINIQEHVTYYSDEDAKSAFNADTVITYDVKITGLKYSSELAEVINTKKYKHCKALVLQKENRGFLVMYCFYSNKAKKNIDSYMKSLDSIFRYED